jgi:hypothetical protein
LPAAACPSGWEGQVIDKNTMYKIGHQNFLKIMEGEGGLSVTHWYIYTSICFLQFVLIAGK